MVDRNRGGGEHHLFMRRSLDLAHPDYQLEVDDVASAVFAIDFVTEHGEGNVIDTTGLDKPDEELALRHLPALLRAAGRAVRHRAGGRRVPWNPAYPTMRNPTLRPGNSARDLVTNEDARAAIALFNRCYAITMQMMVQHFGISPDKSLRRSKLMNASLDLMTGVLRPVAEHIVTLPSGRRAARRGPPSRSTASRRSSPAPTSPPGGRP